VALLRLLYVYIILIMMAMCPPAGAL
jgi:hypothetical protein